MEYPIGVITVANENKVIIKREKLMDVGAVFGTVGNFQVINTGNFANSGFNLDPMFNWQIIACDVYQHRADFIDRSRAPPAKIIYARLMIHS